MPNNAAALENVESAIQETEVMRAWFSWSGNAEHVPGKFLTYTSLNYVIWWRLEKHLYMNFWETTEIFSESVFKWWKYLVYGRRHCVNAPLV